MSKVTKCDVCGENINMKDDHIRFEVHEISSPDIFTEEKDEGVLKDICYNCFDKIFISNKIVPTKRVDDDILLERIRKGEYPRVEEN